MPRIVRDADAAWEGNLARGAGTLAAATSGAFTGLGFSLATRVGAPEGKASPEELLAAAHAACFTMSLANELTAAGMPPGQLDVRCRITMDEVDGKGHLIVRSALDVTGRVPDAEPAGFDEAVEKANAGCPFSTLLRDAGAGVDVTTQLQEGD